MVGHQSRPRAPVDRRGADEARGTAGVRSRAGRRTARRRYPPQSSATVPDDFQRELDKHPAAREFFRTLTGADRYAFLYRLHHTKDPRRRAERIRKYIEVLSEHKTLTHG
ncbi:MAG: YdeI/OmpD-associated family protein [Solirubrobacterales bacterium]|nr:YdeI/OmpD-associated family protein [Solirubrobacterales bacterium]